MTTIDWQPVPLDVMRQKQVLLQINTVNCVPLNKLTGTISPQRREVAVAEMHLMVNKVAECNE